VRVLVRIGLLVALWLLAWGQVSLANVLSGVVVAVALLGAFPPRGRGAPRVGVRPAGIARLAGYVAVQLVVSNVLMTRHILSRRGVPDPGVIAHRLRQPCEEAVTLMTSVIALSPGTMAVDVDDASTTVYVHFFRLPDVDAARAALDRLDQLVVGALAVTRGRAPAPTPKESP
jgi:multicomponent Na+:H+ antiporter subunit E